MVAEWILTNLANGAEIVLSAQLTLTESVRFECSDVGLFVLAKLSPLNDAVGPKDTLKLIVGKSEIGLDPIFMLEAEPKFWAGNISDTQSAISLLAVSPDITVIAPGRTAQLDIDKVKMQNFVLDCRKRIGKS